MLTKKQTIVMISRTVRRAEDKVALNETWKTLNLQHGIGRLQGRQLALSDQDHQHLRRLLIMTMNFDPLLDDVARLGGDRLQQSQFRDEKVGGARAGSGIVMLGSATGELALHSGCYRLPPGATLNVPSDELAGISRIVLVENLAVMYSLSRYRWPDDFAGLPMLFRGSPQVTPAAVTQALAYVAEVICFPDFDPQGIRNSLVQPKACAIIVPTEAAIAGIVTAGRDKPQDYERQSEARLWLRRQENPAAQRLIRLQRAISQESMAGYELEVSKL